MIYLDNAATSFPKPRTMLKAMEDCMLNYCGNPGRSGHYMSMRTGEEVYRARRKVSDFFKIDEGERIIFTKNATEALNLGIKGILKKGDSVITTSMEHNSVLRPLKELESSGVTCKIVRADRHGYVRPSDIEKVIEDSTRLIVVTAASNVTGTRQPIGEIGRLAHKKGICFMVDAAQAAGSTDLNVKRDCIDMLAFPGHKSLFGPLGVGALYIGRGVNPSPLLCGGTGTASKQLRQPPELPEKYEAGTLNAPAIIGLGYGIDYIEKIGVDVIEQYENQLLEYFENEAEGMDFVTLYGPRARACAKSGYGPVKTGISLFNIEGISPEEVTEVLSSRYGIAVRGGFHCAPLAHKTIGTWNSGAVRVSVGIFNTRADMERLCEAVWEIGRSVRTKQGS